jgi:hypothetical protein
MTDNPRSEADIVLQTNAVLAPLGPQTAKSTSITAGQLEATREIWTSTDGQVEAGVWEATSGSFRAVREGYHEICQILAGRATIEVADREPFEISAGDTVVTPNGWSGTWHVHETIRKTYVIINVR